VTFNHGVEGSSPSALTMSIFASCFPKDFSWNDTEALVVRQQDAIAVYANPAGDLVIRRRQAWDENEDVWILISQSQVQTVVEAMQRVLKEVQEAS
jgi:hypothetical protein